MKSVLCRDEFHVECQDDGECTCKCHKHGWKRVGVHTSWAKDCRISESVQIVRGDSTTVRRFTATICGYQNFLLWQGDIYTPGYIDRVKEAATSIRDRIERRDETVFSDKSLVAAAKAPGGPVDVQ